MLNTNRIIDYLTQRHPSVEQTAGNSPDKISNALSFNAVESGQGRGVAGPAKEMLTDLRSSYADLPPQSMEPSTALSQSENFMLGEGVTSFYLPSRF